MKLKNRLNIATSPSPNGVRIVPDAFLLFLVSRTPEVLTHDRLLHTRPHCQLHVTS
jgi:hypothetical protein